MTQNPRKFAGTPVVALLMLGMTGLLGLTGCTGTDTLDLGVEQLDFEFTGVNASATSWNCIQLGLSSLTVTSLDGICSAGSTNAGTACHGNTDCPSGTCDGSLSQEVLPDAIRLPIPDGKLAFQNGECPDIGLSIANSLRELPSLVLPSGLYRINSLEVGGGFLLDLDDSGFPVDFRTCNGDVELAPTYGSGRIFRIGVDGISKIRLSLDLTAFENLLVGNPPCGLNLAGALGVQQIP